ncbi:scm-like with four MBT domains protein 1 [Bufo gargarizans]|uniref:scm-like with four MBT domains protein 1 n=1 Tax=Bufo gargarizans TaxID=30331 RepID=UPI001CF48CB9|nr:scm-like with four MBT domains protein 1 [Bufo gargarizans]
MGTLSAGLMSQTPLANPTGGPPTEMIAQGKKHEDTNADSSLEEAEFNWEEYLEETGSTTAPHSFFKHVDTSMQTGLSPGMKLEVPLGTDPQSYWIASIITTCGKLLLLRYDGCGEDRSADFWCDIVTSDLHSIGWAQQNKKTLRPPEILKDKLQNWEEFLAETLKGAFSAPTHLLEGPHRGKDPLDLFGPGCRLELQHSQDSLATWPVQVLDNIGGRLQLQYEGAPDCPLLHCFYLNSSLHEIGWANRNGYELKPPKEIVSLNTDEKWKEILTKCLEDSENFVPTEFFQEQAQIPNHTFKSGMKIEAINPKDPSCIVPATVTEVFNDQYFLVELDDLRPDNSTDHQSMVCHRNSPHILPARWSLKMGLTVCSPSGYSEEVFDWDKYLTHCNAHAAPDSCFPEVQNEHVLQERMKLEAVNPFQPRDICIATVTRVNGLYIWLQLEGVKTPVPECIVHVESTDLFPMGWCETNGHPLCTPPPTNAKPRKKTARHSQKQDVTAKNKHGVNESDTTASNITSNGKYLCPKIFFNHRCFSGPYLNKGRIAELPKSVGPGNCVLVLKEVLSLIINAAYKPSRVLHELELQDEPLWPQHAEILKAKYKGKTYRATVELVRTSDQVSEFCRKTCIKLECCPNLFGPLMVLDQCSENCSVLTKTKYTHYYGKRRGRNLSNPTGILRSIEAALKKPAKRRKRRKHFFVHKKKRSSNSVENTPVGSPQGSGDEEEEEDEDYSPSEESVQEHQEGSELSGKGSSSASPTRSEQSLNCEKKRKPWMLESEKLLSAKDIRIELKEPLTLNGSPLDWTVNDVVEYIKSTDCNHLARLFQEQEIDGRALLLLNLPAVQDCMDLKPAMAIKLCYHIERVKLAFYQSFSQ